MGALSQAFEIIFQVQRKRSNEKIAKRKVSFSTYETLIFFLFSSLWTPPTFKSSNFHISYSF